jgi:hypothetical protein
MTIVTDKGLWQVVAHHDSSDRQRTMTGDGTPRLRLDLTIQIKPIKTFQKHYKTLLIMQPDE